MDQNEINSQWSTVCTLSCKNLSAEFCQLLILNWTRNNMFVFNTPGKMYRLVRDTSKSIQPWSFECLDPALKFWMPGSSLEVLNDWIQPWSFECLNPALKFWMPGSSLEVLNAWIQPWSFMNAWIQPWIFECLDPALNFYECLDPALKFWMPGSLLTVRQIKCSHRSRW